MFQKFTLYAFTGPALDAETLGDHLAALAYHPAGSTMELAFGFVPPREEHGAMVEAIGGELIAKVMIERRSVPGAALRKRVEEDADKIEQTTGRKPGKKERRALKEDALLALLPQAFPKHQGVPIWFDRLGGYLVVGATVGTVLDLVVTALVRAVPDLVLTMVQTQTTPASLMAGWLIGGEAAGEFSLGRECELRSHDEEKSAVKFTHHSLENDEIGKHVAEGKLPKRLALQWKDRVSFRLSDTMAVDKVDFLEGCFAATGTEQEAADAFDADVAIYTGELRAMIADLISELCGVMEFQPAAPESAPQRAAAKPPADVLAGIMAQHPDADPKLIEMAASLVMAPNGRASISYVQRTMKIGYNAAARVLEMLQDGGLVSAMDSTGARTVLVKGGQA